ncbi:hypothetical protein K488DRAFT_82138 [Vararia minispora EC-137]|uniref:Uncharacterized protein n=1 Tax=Vararia minispora EC-137 TaxID=1314806 RepID=A0ACB8QWV1_9AGAM|nr:hypothetical protein K488DRAFT_82138 [Vararia minispora EC-137]
MGFDADPKAFPDRAMTAGDTDASRSLLAEAWLVGPLFGANIVLYSLCVALLNKHIRKPQGFRYRCLQVVATVQILIAATHAATLLARAIEAFVVRGADSRDARNVYLDDQTKALEILGNALYIANDVIGSCILVWRCYIVWAENVTVVLPLIICSAATALCGFVGIASQGMLRSPPNPVTSGAGALLVSFWCLSFITQAGVTSLIAWKIWSTIAWRTDRMTSLEWAVIRIVVESGAIYSAATIVALALYPHDPHACSVVSGLLAQISAMAPYLIIVRVEAQRESFSMKEREDNTGNGMSSAMPLSEISIPVVLSRKANRSTRYQPSDLHSDAGSRIGPPMIDLKPGLPDSETVLTF